MVGRISVASQGSEPDPSVGTSPGLEPLSWLPAGYTVLGEIGRGFRTVVVRVRYRGSDYALKITERPADEAGPELAAFHREASILACVDHPRLPRIHEVGMVRGHPYLVMDFVEGRKLSSRLAADRLTERVALMLALDVAGGLAAAHRAGLVHRDVKPDNIIVGEDGAARLVDFGMAAKRAEGAADQMAGTLLYSPPEQSGMLNRPVDGRSDLYSLGAVLFECVTGVPPFTAADVGELLRAHATIPAPDVCRLRPELSEEFGAIVARLLAKDPDDRYPRAEDLLADVRQALDAQRAAEASTTTVPGQAGPCRSAGPARPAAEHPSAGDSDPGGGQPDIAFIGRRGYLDRLHDRWRQAREGRGNAVVVLGPGGIGKTRLVTEFCQAVRASGHPVLRGRCTSADPAPLTPLRQAISDHARRADHTRIQQAAAPVAAILRSIVPDIGAAPTAATMIGEGQRDPVTTAIAAYLTRLADLESGLVLHLDDGHRSDQATLEVVRRLSHDLPTIPMLVIVTARDDPTPAEPLAALRTALPEPTRLDLTVDRLSPGEIAQVVRAYLPGATIDPARLAARSDGNPFALLEYLRLIVELGLLRPSWGTWLLDLGELDRLDLSGNPTGLVRRRLTALDETTHGLLRTAALCGDRFSGDLVAAVHGMPIVDVLHALSEAVEHHLIEVLASDDYGFLHDRIVEALRSEIGPEDQRRLHQMAAESLDRSPAASSGADQETLYSMAHHYLHGETSRTPHRLLLACKAAGEAAMVANAPADALMFLEPAADIGDAEGVPLDGGFLILLAEAQHQSGHFADAHRSLERALVVERDPIILAKAYSRIARVQVGLFRLEEAIASCRAGLARLGEPVPSGHLALAVSTGAQVAAAAFLEWMGIGFGTASAEQRARYMVHANLYETFAQASALGLRRGPTLVATLRTLLAVHRVGPSLEYARAFASLGYSCHLYGWHRLADWLCARGSRSAATVPDPRLAAIAEHLDALSAFLCGIDDGRRIGRCLQIHGRWVDVSLYRDAVKTLCRYEAVRGNTADGKAWYEQGISRIGDQSEAGWDAAAVALDAVAGDPSKVARRLEAIPVVPVELGLARRLEAVIVRLHAAVEQGDLGESFEHWASEFARLNIDLRELTHRYRPVYAHLAYGRLEQCRIRADQPFPLRLRAADAAVLALGRAANSDYLRACHQVARASLRQLRGDNSGALHLLSSADTLLYDARAPLVDYEAARIRARALAATDRELAARQQAQYALLLATQHGWTTRMRWVVAEFGAADVALATAGGLRHSAGGGTGNTSQAARRLAALEQVSLAASRILDPDELARVALDETIRILAADRALLFLSEGEKFVPHLGRDSQGRDMASFGGFSTTLVSQVCQTRDVIVVTGSDEGLAFGAASMAVHGLRSIMVAPLQLEGRLLGAVYLDSRVAKGMFTADDAGLLLSIVNHIAVTLETARAARLEAAVEAARRQKAVAERLQAAMTALSEPLDPGQVLDQLVGQLVDILPGDRSHLLRYRDDSTAVRLGEVIRGSADAPVPTGLGQTGRELSAWLAQVPQASVWLALPLAARSGPVGIAVVAASPETVGGPEYLDQQIEVAAILVRHAMTAYDNARNYATMRAMAATDELTGIPNRRHFLELALPMMSATEQPIGSPTAIMIDIDRFKTVNDTYGHQVGDEVICGVAARISMVIRADDVLGRYGGEEFALMLPSAEGGGPAIADRIRASVARSPIETSAGPVTVTVSVGVASAPGDPAAAESLSLLLSRADRALYQAKAAGRDRVVVLAGH